MPWVYDGPSSLLFDKPFLYDIIPPAVVRIKYDVN